MKSDVIARQLGDSAVLIRLQTNRIYELNQTGARVWELLVEGRGAAEIAGILQQEFDSPPGSIESEVTAIIDSLSVEGLL